jgi:hypothetical protein
METYRNSVRVLVKTSKQNNKTKQHNTTQHNTTQHSTVNQNKTKQNKTSEQHSGREARAAEVWAARSFTCGKCIDGSGGSMDGDVRHRWQLCSTRGGSSRSSIGVETCACMSPCPPRTETRCKGRLHAMSLAQLAIAITSAIRAH